jgi:hypothetical protein
MKKGRSAKTCAFSGKVCAVFRLKMRQDQPAHFQEKCVRFSVRKCAKTSLRIFRKSVCGFPSENAPRPACAFSGKVCAVFRLKMRQDQPAHFQEKCVRFSVRKCAKYMG